jgi:hypothetical protein
MTNSEIVSIVFETYKVRSLIHKMIQQSLFDHTDVDLEQYIYSILLTFNNERLNKMFNDNTLRNFISRIIKNQRNNGKFYHSLQLRFCELGNYDVPDVDQHNYVLDFVMDKIECINFFLTGQTQLELRKDLSITLLYLYLVKNEPKWKLCIDYRIGTSTLNLLLSDAKKYLREEYDNSFETYVEKISII